MISEPGQNPMIQDLVRHLDADQIGPAQRRLQVFDAVELLEISTDVGNRHLVDAMCADSYIHANGFYKISFPYSQDSPVRVRLHIWPGDDLMDNEPDAHNHKWSFVSKVLAGKLTHDVLHVSPGSGEYHHYEYKRVGRGHQYIHSGIAELELRRVEDAPGGIVYSMDARTVHRVRPEECGYTATLVVELAPARAQTDIFVTHGGKPEGVTVVTERLKTNQIPAVLRDILSKMRKAV
jgi:hypothetical protein